jgi:hypothetical protein
MKILILIIFSDSPEYNRMRDILRKYTNNYENVDSYFIQSSYIHNEKVYIENDMSFVRCPETHSCILHKTLSTLDYLTNFCGKEYDFVIRTNISTIINIPKLLNFLKLFLDKEYLYGGDVVNWVYYKKNLRYALGTCIIISKSLYKQMTKELNKFTEMPNDMADDQAIGLYVQKNCPQAFDHLSIKPFDHLSIKPSIFYTHTVNGLNSTLNDFIDYMNKNPDHNSVILYRNKTNNRNEDANIMEYICDNLL